jgi:glycosyltransferase involved in cell wall biosynthesis
MRILCLVDAPVIPPDRWIWNYLPAGAQSDTVDFMCVRSRDIFPKWGKLITYYPAYWQLAIRALRQCQKADYDLVVAWESKNGFPLAILRSILNIKEPRLVILAFSFKGIATRFLFLSRLVTSGATHMTVLSPAEIEYYQGILGIPPGRITFSPLGWYDVFSDTGFPAATGDYIFSSGRSYRDYGTLLKAITGLEAQLIINARRFNVQGYYCPPNVRINDLMPMAEFHALMVAAQFVILPLQDTPHAAGEGHIIQSMSAGKALIATRTASTENYVEDGKTGILVTPYNVDEMRSAIAYLLAHSEEAQAMGRRARQRYEEKYTFTAFAERTYEVLQKVAGGEAS